MVNWRLTDGRHFAKDVAIFLKSHKIETKLLTALLGYHICATQ